MVNDSKTSTKAFSLQEIGISNYTLDVTVAMILSSLSLFLADSAQTVGATLISVLYVLFTLTRPRHVSLLYIAFALSNTHILNIFGVSASVCICVICACRYIFYTKKINKFLLLFAGFYLIYSLQYVIRYSDVSSGVISALKTIAVLTFFYFLSTDDFYLHNIRSHTVNAMLFCVYGIITNLFITILITGYVRARVLNNDSNMLAVEAAVMISIACVFFIRHNAISVYKFWFVLLSMTLVIVLSGSRNGYLLLAICLFFTLLLNLRRLSKISVLIIAAAVCACFVLVSESGQNAVATLLNRTEVLMNKDDFSNGRFEIWRTYLEAFNSNKLYWLFGFGDYRNIGITEMGHNGLIEDIAAYGLVGTCAIVLTALKIWKTLKDNVSAKSRKTFFSLLPLVIIFVGSITLRSLTNIINLTMIYMSISLLLSEPLDEEKAELQIKS